MHEITYTFEELPTVTTPDGFEAGEVRGTAGIRFTDEGEFFIKDIHLDGSRRRPVAQVMRDVFSAMARDPLGNTARPVPAYDSKPVEIERGTFLYNAIHDQLELGRFRKFVEAKISEHLDDLGIARRDQNAEHRVREAV